MKTTGWKPVPQKIMCGIVGILVKNKQRRASLGQFLIPMFQCMADRGADSAGLAVFSDPLDRAVRRFSLYSPDRVYKWNELGDALQKQIRQPVKIDSIENHAGLITAISAQSLGAWLVQYDPTLHVLSVGRSIDVYKDIGHACD